MGDPNAKDLKFMRWCTSGAELFATCGKRKYMAIIVDQRGHVMGTGYNGGPPGMYHCEDGGCPRLANRVPSGTPYDSGPGLCIAVHAEANALLHSDYTGRGDATLYVNGPPCFGCAKLITNSGVRRVVYLPDEGYAEFGTVLRFFEEAGIEAVEIEL